MRNNNSFDVKKGYKIFMISSKNKVENKKPFK